MLYAASLSLQGKRTSNQDRILITPAEYSGGSILAAVADGLGGMKSGDKAAEIAVETLKEASHVRHLKSSENITVVVNGVGSTLTLTAKKSAVDDFAAGKFTPPVKIGGVKIRAANDSRFFVG